MYKIKIGKFGFTLVELMIVAIIVAILAVVAVPLMRGNTQRAIATEAEAALGSVRTALRVVLAEHGAYNVGVTTGAVVGNVPGFRARTATIQGDLDGTYFSEECYTVTAVGAGSFTVQCVWNNSTNAGGFTPRAGEVNTTGNTTAIDHNGNITRTGY